MLRLTGPDPDRTGIATICYEIGKGPIHITKRAPSPRARRKFVPKSLYIRNTAYLLVL